MESLIRHKAHRPGGDGGGAVRSHGFKMYWVPVNIDRILPVSNVHTEAARGWASGQVLQEIAGAIVCSL